jgi:hypothetical protein
MASSDAAARIIVSVPSVAIVQFCRAYRATMISPYDVLGVSWDADDEAIRAAFRKAAKACHPDLNAGDEAAEQQFLQVVAARDAIVKDRELQAALDRHLAVDVGQPFEDRPPVRRRSKFAAAGSVMFAVVCACLISASLVLLSQPAAMTSPAGPTPPVAQPAPALATTTTVFRPHVPSRRLDRELTARPATDHRADLTTTNQLIRIGTLAVETPDNGAQWWRQTHVYSAATSWPADDTSKPVAMPSPRPRVTPNDRDTARPARAGHPVILSAVASRKPKGRASAAAPPPPAPVSMPFSPSHGCRTDEGGGRWSPCGASGGGDGGGGGGGGGGI